MDRSRFIKAGGLIDGSGAGLRRDVTVEIEDGVIVAINEGRQLPRGVGVDELPHCLLLPPLVDASLLLTRSPSVTMTDKPDSPEDRATLVARHLGYCHAHGVLGLAVGDQPSEVAPAWRDWGYDKGLLELRVAGPACRESGGDFLRLRLSADIDAGQTDPFTPSPDLAVSLATRGEKKVVMVANGAEAVAEALAAGCDAIEQGYAMGEDNLRTLAERGVLWIPSLVRAKNGVDGAGGGGDIACRFSQRYVAPGKPVPGAEALWKKMLAGQLAQLRLARSLGVVTALGSGAGNIGLSHGESLIEEMKLFVKGGYPLAEIFHATSEVAARFFAMNRLGRLAVGRPATFLIVRGSLQQLPRKLYFLEGIIVDGSPCPHYRKNPPKAVAGKN
jgi:imidazolonepropionase-like amidohydrolase